MKNSCSAIIFILSYDPSNVLIHPSAAPNAFMMTIVLETYYSTIQSDEGWMGHLEAEERSLLAYSNHASHKGRLWVGMIE